MSRLAHRLSATLHEQVSIQSLVVLRICFGLLMAWDVAKMALTGEMKTRFLDDYMKFPHFGLDFIQPLPADWMMVAVWLTIGVAALLIALGAWFRISAGVFVVLFGYLFLLDRTFYLNHFYMIELFAILLWITPAHRAISIDAWRRPDIAVTHIPYWPVAVIRAQTEIILFYAGFVKIADDWLRGAPFQSSMEARSEAFFISWVLSHPWMAIAATWSVVIMHCVGAPLLYWRRTRLLIFGVYTVFHYMNSVFFNIGVFPVMTWAITLIFFDPNWPSQVMRNLSRGLGGRFVTDKPEIRKPDNLRIGRLMGVFLMAWFAIQIAVPMRQAWFPNLVGWTTDGHRFSWRMMIYSISAEGQFLVVPDGVERGTDGVIQVDPGGYYHPARASYMLGHPDVILDTVDFLEAKYESELGTEVAIYGDIRKFFNNRSAQQFVDPDIDLTTRDYQPFREADWILPNRYRGAPNIPEWFPPLPLDKPDPDFESAPADLPDPEVEPVTDPQKGPRRDAGI